MWSIFISIMEYSKITDKNLLRKLLILETPQNMRFYIMIIWNPTLKAQMKTTNCSSSDSCSDMDVDNTEDHKEQSILKQEQIDRKAFFTILTMIKI